MNIAVECAIPQGTPVLVTGATGFTGNHLTRKLIKAGLKVSAIARQSSDLSPLNDLDIQWFKGEVYDEEVVARAVAGQQYIFHLAAAFRQAKSTAKDYWNVHVKSTQVLADNALQQENFKRFIHVSTIGVHGHIANPPATEEYPYDPGDEYQRTKLQAEIWLNTFAGENDLAYTIIRPAAIYGPGDRRLLKLFKMALKRYFPILGNGKCLYHLVHVDDLTDTFILAATNEAALGETFISGADEAIAIEDMAGIVAQEFGRELKVVRLPIRPFYWLGDICEAVCKPFGVEPPLYRRRVAFYSKDRSFDVSKLKNSLGYAPKYGNREGIIETARWYRSQGLLK